jgi:hypothetical protein
VSGNYQVVSQDSDFHAISLLRPVLSPALVAANTTAEQSFVVPALNPPAGFAVAQAAVFASKPTAQAGLGIAGVRVVDATHIGITFMNDTAGGLTPTAAETYQILVVW